MKNTVKQIDEILEALGRDKISNLTGDQLSRAIGELSIQNVYLGQLVAEAEYLYSEATNFRKYKEADECLVLSRDNPVTRAKLMAEIEIRQYRDDESKTLSEYRKLKNKHQDVANIISVMQSRIRHLENEARETRFVDNNSNS